MLNRIVIVVVVDECGLHRVIGFRLLDRRAEVKIVQFMFGHFGDGFEGSTSVRGGRGLAHIRMAF
jgi:hypothetical protein